MSLKHQCKGKKIKTYVATASMMLCLQVDDKKAKTVSGNQKADKAAFVLPVASCRKENLRAASL